MSLCRAVVMQSRGLLLRTRRRTFSTTGATDQEQVRRTNIVREIDELKAKVKREMIEDVEKVKRVENEDRNVLSRLLTFCGMPRGVFRDNLVFGCNVVAVFVASGVVGACSAGWRDARRKRAKFGTNA
ncbi:uncharacterized protein [Oryza sativa Japonica Group]|uniref:Os07g0109800 protein n=3 Tax=Oryza sativa TaxID=4530 RepID=A3BFW0_ORYSJ|nr:uncharacterized protein LOC4342222 [Oryza sativa Japonica Group]EEC81399.1 hypothetical protein OsI_24628 [Oryza sativa Indica Group]KAB8104075.1 hypothetical protein EE612_036722 [Oryza sativa]EAZ38449.1 hypothetical protein OsJ_22829 [Oryza sativa Japonica Group]KAF2921128.1 hypothetical protein DAI22_07g006900 [Oryza sativa Japonica Group]BAC06943.1 hypothetical protein [Oryza sativa Japonica Group]|eukprot:NP_001058727.1 Os07g0109800 [Oryza sativa Japonica Group]